MRWFNVLAANTRKVAIELLRYWPNTISTFVTFYIIFLMLFLGIRTAGNPISGAADIRYLIAVMALWFLALTAMQGIGRSVASEAVRGTLEQLYMSPVSTWSILLARMIGSVVIQSSVMVSMLGVGMLTARQWLSLDVITLAPLLLLTVIAMWGVGFVMAAFALVFKQIQSLFQIVQFVLLALVAVPVTLSPWLELAPAVRASSMVRAAMIDGVDVTGFAGTEWLLLIGNATLYFGIGVAAFRLAERSAMRRGLLGQY